MRPLTAAVALVLASSSPAQDFHSSLVDPGAAAGDRFGSDIATYSAAPYAWLVVGAGGATVNGFSEAGKVCIFERQGAHWVWHTTLLNPFPDTGDEFGYSVDVWGPTVVVGARRDDSMGADSGAVYVYSYDLSSQLWTPVNQPLPAALGAGDQLGASVSIHETAFAAGAPGDSTRGPLSGAVYVGSVGSAAYTPVRGSDIALYDFFGFSVSLHGQELLVGALYQDMPDVAPAGGVGLSNAGAAYFWDGNFAGPEAHKLTAPQPAINDYFGISVALSDGGFVIGEEGHNSLEGAVHQYSYSAGGSPPLIYLGQRTTPIPAGNGAPDSFGNNVDIWGDRWAASAPGRDHPNGAMDIGAAFYSPGLGANIPLVEIPDPQNMSVPENYFPTSVAVWEEFLFGSAPGELCAAGADCGSVQVFTIQATLDCNGNGVHDWTDIANGAPDTNGNGIPDSCEVGLSYCVANNNSTVRPGGIQALGSRSVAANDLTLMAYDLPPDAVGYFLASRTSGLVQPPGSQGNLCLTGNIGRFSATSQVWNTGGRGMASLVVDLTAIPVNPAAPVLPNTTWYFQAWHRDLNPGPTSNFTDAVSVTFQ